MYDVYFSNHICSSCYSTVVIRLSKTDNVEGRLHGNAVLRDLILCLVAVEEPHVTHPGAVSLTYHLHVSMSVLKVLACKSTKTTAVHL